MNLKLAKKQKIWYKLKIDDNITVINYVIDVLEYIEYKNVNEDGLGIYRSHIVGRITRRRTSNNIYMYVYIIKK